jgi:hypothetical protein
MPVAESRPDPEELERLAKEVYDHRVRPRLRPEDEYKFVAIDVETGDFEVDANDYTAVMQLRGRNPSAEIWLDRVGWIGASKLRSPRIIGAS